MDRRQLLGSGLALGAVLTGPAFIWGCAKRGETGEASERQRAMLGAVADLVIPRTDTASAGEVGVPAFVELALKHGLDGTGEAAASAAIQGAAETGPRDRGGVYLLGEFETALDEAAGGDFMRLPPPRRQTVLAGLDAAAFADKAPPVAWRKIKDLILIGYYSSEIGASKELQYELVPGRYDPDLPVAANRRSWSSDWTARDFG